jgi:hypothetical protein
MVADTYSITVLCSAGNRIIMPPTVIFLAYSFRWVRPRDELGIDPCSDRFRGLSRVRRQLLGEPADRLHQWGLQPAAVPLQAELNRLGLLG